MTLQSVHPATSKVLRTYAPYSNEELGKMLQTSEQAFALWKKNTYAERGQWLLTCSTLLRKQAPALAKLMAMEMGKPVKEGLAEIEKCAYGCEYFAREAESLLKNETIASEASESYIQYEPLGCILGIMPWNFPFWQVFRFAAPTLMAGNVIMIKHAPNTCGCALQIEKLFYDAGFPEGVVQCVLIENEACADLIAHPTIKAISLTGSERAGIAVASQAGKHIKKCVLELGGSDPFLVLPDADLDLAVATALKSRFQNAGQSCIAAKRWIVHQSLAQAFTDKLIAQIDTWVVGDPEAEGTHIGPMARPDLAQQLAAQVEQSVRLGAQILYQHPAQPETGAFFPPMILNQVTKGMPAYEEELFGPVGVLFTYQEIEEAIHLANDTKYGLGATIITRDTSTARQIASQLECGNVFINGMVRSDPRLPFGGVKLSGYGHELSELGIKEFVNAKTVWVR